MRRRAGSLRWTGRVSGKHLPMVVTAIYLLSGAVWMFIAVSFVRHDVTSILEDSLFIACTAGLLYLLLHFGVRTVRGQESALMESEDRLARILRDFASNGSLDPRIVSVLIDEFDPIRKGRTEAEEAFTEEFSRCAGGRGDGLDMA